MQRVLLGLGLAALLGVSACSSKLDQKGFRRAAEEAYREANGAGWSIAKRTQDETILVRGDQLDTLDIAEMWKDYQASGKPGDDYFEAWSATAKAEADARRRTLAQAKEDVIPIIKSGSWVKVQDLGAVAPARVRDQIRPWRKEIASDVYMVLGVPEEKLGYRLVSIEEMKGEKDGEDPWIARATKNLVRIVGTSTSGGAAIKNDKGIMVLDMPNKDGVSGLLLDKAFRQEMLRLFDQPFLGAAAPTRNVLILFDPESFVTTKPVRARTHQLYDTQNHPGFRGMMRFDAETISVLEPARPKKKLRVE